MSTATADFYVTGGTLRHDSPSYVERQADRDLYDALSRSEFCYVLTARQMGKSSLMTRTAARLREEGVAVVVLDLTAVGQNLSPDQWYDGLRELLGQQLDLEDELDEVWHEHTHLGPLQRWLTALREVILVRCPGRIVIFLDEIDTVRSLPFSTDEFFAAIRECYNRRTEDPEFERLTFCLLGVASPSDLIQDTRLTPFNIGTRIELTDFTESEAAPLIVGLGQKGTMARALLERVLYWTGGHPYLTQRLCRALAEDASVAGSDDVDRLCGDLFLSPRARERDDNLLFVRERMLRSEVDLSALLDLYGRVRRGGPVQDDETSPLVSLLRLSGIVRAERGALQVRNRIYGEVFGLDWVRQQMPGAELRRQQAAYRRGLARATALAVFIVAVVGGLALTAMRQARRADHQRRLAEARGAEARQLLYIANMNLASQDWEKHNLGRLRRLLVETQENRDRGFEWYYWQRQCHRERITLWGHAGAVNAVAFSRDGRRIVTGGGDGAARLWDASSGRELLTLSGHRFDVYTVAFSPDNQRIVTGGPDRTARVWSAITGRQLVILNGHSSPVRSVAFSEDSTHIVTGSNDGSARVWDATSGRTLHTLVGHATPVVATLFLPDGRQILTAGLGGAVRAWDAATGRATRTIRADTTTPIGSVAFSRDGRRLLTGSTDGTATLWDAATGRKILVLHGHQAQVNAVTFSPDGRRLLTGGMDGTARLWDVGTGREILTLAGHESYVRSVAFSPDGYRIVTGGDDHTAKVWDTEPEGNTLNLQRRAAPIGNMVFSPDGRRLLTGTGDGAAQLWDIASGRELRTMRGHKRELVRVAFFPDGRRFLTAAWDAAAKVWDAAAGRELLTLDRLAYFFPIDISPDSRRLVVATGDSTATVWDIATRTSVRTLKGHSGWVQAVAFAPNGRQVLTGSIDSTAKLWDVATGGTLFTLRGHTRSVAGVRFSPDGRRILTASKDNKVNLWDAATGRLLSTHPMPLFEGTVGIVGVFAFSPDGRRLLTVGAESAATVWDSATGRKLYRLQGHAGGIGAAAFSPDSSRIMTGGQDSVVKLWDVVTGREILALQGLGGPVHTVAFSPDGRRILAGTLQGTAKLWDAASPQQVAHWTATEREGEKRMAAARSRTEREQRELAARAATQAAARNARESGPPGRALPGNLLVNGSFEDGVESGATALLAVDSVALAPWRVTRGTIEVKSYQQASHGRRSLDLNGDRAGAVAQTFRTRVGQRHQVTFDLAGHPGLQGVTQVLVSTPGNKARFTFDSTGRSDTDMGWVGKRWEFTALSPKTTIEFRSLGTEENLSGPAVDNVAVVAVEGAGG